ncbi:MAG: signal peptidase I [Bacteroidetes bacterium]|nr:signal peptidase I [Bacteroidota bacterium]
MENIKQVFKKYKEYRKKRKEKLDAKKPQNFKESAISLLKSLLFALVFVMIIHGVLVGSFVVPTGSMENTVLTGDFLLVHKLFGPSTPQLIPFFNIPLPYILLPAPKEPKKGDVIVFVFPGNREEIVADEFTYYLKRCVAEPGDVLEIKDNVLYVNGEKYPIPPESKISYNKTNNLFETNYTFPTTKPYTTTNYGPIKIPKKGDILEIKNYEDYLDWRVFIEREGHIVNWLGKLEIDNKIVATNTYTVQEDYYFGMGDNRDHSLDSRMWGFIPRKHILGSPIVCWFSWEMHDEYEQERNILDKILNIRFSRMFRTIN